MDSGCWILQCFLTFLCHQRIRATSRATSESMARGLAHTSLDRDGCVHSFSWIVLKAMPPLDAGPEGPLAHSRIWNCLDELGVRHLTDRCKDSIGQLQIKPDALRLRPFALKHALPFCRQVHRRLSRLQGGMWSIAIQVQNEILGVAIVGRPVARLLDNGLRLQVLRVAVKSGTPNACSMLYGACSRAARAMGASDLLTYIHNDETGVSLKASGWIEDDQFRSRGGEWSRKSRTETAAEEPGEKRRWWAPWSQAAKAIIARRQNEQRDVSATRVTRGDQANAQIGRKR